MCGGYACKFLCVHFYLFILLGSVEIWVLWGRFCECESVLAGFSVWGSLFLLDCQALVSGGGHFTSKPIYLYLGFFCPLFMGKNDTILLTHLTGKVYLKHLYTEIQASCVFHVTVESTRVVPL